MSGDTWFLFKNGATKTPIAISVLMEGDACQLSSLLEGSLNGLSSLENLQCQWLFGLFYIQKACGWRVEILVKRYLSPHGRPHIPFQKPGHILLERGRNDTSLHGCGHGVRESSYYFFFPFCLFFRATPVAHGNSQAKGRTGATAVGLPHSHSNEESSLCLRPIPQLTAMPNP